MNLRTTLNKTLLLLLVIPFILLNTPEVFAQQNVEVSAVVDREPPGVKITNPSNRDIVYGVVRVSSVITDDGGIQKVEFYLNGRIFLTSVTAPYDFTWWTTGVQNGQYTITIKAYDIAGKTGSDTVTVTVRNLAPTEKESVGEKRRFLLIDLPNLILLGPAEGRNSDFLMGFIVAAETSFIFLLLYLIFHRRIRR